MRRRRSRWQPNAVQLEYKSAFFGERPANNPPWRPPRKLQSPSRRRSRPKEISAEENDMPPKFWIVTGALLAAVAVGAGAIATHMLRPPRLDQRQFESFETAVRYHLFHAVAIVIVGLLVASLPQGNWDLAGWLFLTGSVLFSGGIYTWLLTGVRGFVHATPIGGLCLIAGWIALAVIAIRRL
jgi:uncharacterized membrane protein YgdD (TMEM256/DUF423 family)